ncbi:hypothetical protein HMPREF9003_0124 [Bifidobacterium dentium JCVIHMP022]|uniref:Uncharacterized protein n=1 Tax=Bifidobacterium dentium JCVIHMP022 TaxID=553191 RepID=A0AB72Z3Z9_9BIFI|nr:hypothetical protein HMPREF9003_0124 [Bifidobacterium dentium JCVIHMP022]
MSQHPGKCDGIRGSWSLQGSEIVTNGFDAMRDPRVRASDCNVQTEAV